jgi:soluble lytic murein transglycosylase-like protein
MPLSYRCAFYVCSFSIRSNGAKNEMTAPNRFVRTTIAFAGLIVASFHPVSAQEFTLFEHAVHQPEIESQAETVSQYLPAVHARGKTSISYREGLYMGAIAEAERRYGLPPNLLRALIWAESRFNPMAVSPAGAAGLAQLMPATARELGVRNRHDPIASIDGGARYLRDMLKRFDAVHLALAAYNAGPGAVSRARGIPRNGETPQYVRTVLSRWSAIGAYH